MTVCARGHELRAWGKCPSCNAEDAPTRFWNYVKKCKNGCWEWTGSMSRAGYGYFHIGARKYVRAHRYAWELLRGSCPEGLEPDHLCRNRKCVNPEHLEWVTHLENVQRGLKGVLHWSRQ